MRDVIRLHKIYIELGKQSWWIKELSNFDAAVTCVVLSAGLLRSGGLSAVLLAAVDIEGAT